MDGEIIKAALDGHNFMILGQAGTGKTTLLKKLQKLLLQAGKKVAMTASTGIGNAKKNDPALNFIISVHVVYIYISCVKYNKLHYPKTRI